MCAAHGIHHHGESHIGGDIALQVDIVGAGLTVLLLLDVLFQLAEDEADAIGNLRLDRRILCLPVAEGDEVIAVGLLGVAHHKGELAVRCRRHVGHVDPDVHNARSAIDKAGTVAVDGTVPVWIDGRIGIIGQEIVGIGDGETEFRTVERVMLEPAAQLGLMAFPVVDGDVAELNIVRDDVDGHITGRIVAVHIIDRCR